MSNNTRQHNKILFFTKSLVFLLLCFVPAITACTQESAAGPTNIVKKALEAYRVMDCETFSACLTEEVPSLNQKASGKTSTVQQTLSDLSCKITDSTEQGADAVVTVNVTAVFPPNLISLYFSEMLLRQFDGDLVSSSANEVKEAGTERFDEMIFAPDVDRFSEELELSLRRIGNTWNIIPNDKFVSALSGFQDREATNNPSDE